MHSLPFSERDRIVTLMTPQGVIKLFIKGYKKLNLQRLALSSPFTRGDYLYQVRKNDLHRFIDGTVYDQHFELRDSLEKMCAAKKMVDTLLKTQWLQNPSPDLYNLFARFLKRTCQNPHLFTPFLIKLLKHEGSLDPSSLSTVHRRRLQLIAQTRSFEELESLDYDPSFSEAIEQLNGII